jgi:hypothetical protein
MKGPGLPLHGGLYLVIVMDRCVGPHTSLTIDLQTDFYYATIMDRYAGPIALHRGLYLTNIMQRYEGGTLT